MPRASRSTVAVQGAASIGDRIVREVVLAVLAGERRVAAIGVTFLGPRRMRQLNEQYLGHDAVTDVLSFSLPQPDGALAGDIYICRYAGARHARQHGGGVRAEMLRLVVHGTLHVLGYDHPAGTARTGSAMWRRQEQYLAAFA